MSADNNPGAMRKMPDYSSAVEEDLQDADFTDEYDEYADYDADSLPDQGQRAGQLGELTDDGPDDRETLEELFGAVFDLAGQIASAISQDEVEARLRALREALP